MGNEHGTQAGGARAETVESIDLSNSRLREVPSASLDKYAALTALSLSHNELASAAGVARCGARLRALDLSHNKLADLHAELFTLRELQVLKVAHNQLGSLPAVSALTALKELHANNNAITSVPSTWLFCHNLTVLNLSVNLLKTLPSELCSLPALSKLFVNNNSLTALPTEIGNLSSLVLLNVAENELSTVPPTIGRLSQLTKLYLDNNNLVDVPNEMGSLAALRELNLRSNQLTFLPSTMGNLVNMQLCDLGENPWEENSYASLSEDIPSLLTFLRTARKRNNTMREVMSKSRRRVLSMATTRLNLTASDQRSAFTFVQRKKRLLSLRGNTRKIFVETVVPSYRSLNNGGVFILDAGTKLFLWVGEKASKPQRKKGAFFAQLLAREASESKPTPITVIDNRPKKKKKVEDAEFWVELGDKGPAGPAVNESTAYADSISKLTLFRFQEQEGGRLDISVTVGEELLKDMLKSESCFMLDDSIDLYVWAGLYSTQGERSWAMLKAEALIAQRSRPPCAELLWVVDGMEQLIFKEHFSDWTDITWDLTKKELKEQEASLRASVLESRKVAEELHKAQLCATLREPSAATLAPEADQEGPPKRPPPKASDEEGESESGEDEGSAAPPRRPPPKASDYEESGESDEEESFSSIDEEQHEQHPAAAGPPKRPPPKARDMSDSEEESAGPPRRPPPKASDAEDSNSGSSCDDSEDDMLLEQQIRQRQLSRYMEEKTRREQEMDLARKVNQQKQAELQRLKEQMDHLKLEKEKVEKQRLERETREKREKRERELKENWEKEQQERREKEVQLRKDRENIEKERLAQDIAAREAVLIQKDKLKEKSVPKESSREKEQKEKVQQEKEQRENEAREKEQREKEVREKERKEKEEKARLEKEQRDKEEQEREKAQREKMDKENREKEQKKAEEIEKVRQAKATEITLEEMKQIEQSVQQEMKEERRKKREGRGGEGGDASPSVLPSSNTIRLATKHRTKGPSKHAPTRRGMKEQRAYVPQAQISSTVHQDNPIPVPPQSSGTTSTAKPSARMLGAYGLLCSLKADDFLVQKRQSKQDQALKKILETSNLVPKDLPRLLHVKGRRRPFARQVELTWKSLNSGDCFVLDSGKATQVIYQWNGKESNRIERGKAMDVAKSIKDKERFGAKVIVVDENEEPEEVWKILGGRPTGGHVAPASQGGDDVEAEQAIGRYVSLFKVHSDEPYDKIDLEKVSEDGRSLCKAMISPTCCYLLDCTSEIFVWTALKAPPKLRRQLLAMAENLYAERSASFWVCPVHHEFAGSEQVMFKERFNDWGSVPIGVSVSQQAPSNVSASRPVETKIDVEKMFAPKHEKEQVMIDDGSGKIKIWRVEEFSKVEIPEEKYGEFYSAESYVVLYTYIWKNKDCFLIYFWQGRNSTIVGKGTSAYMAVDLDDRLKSSGMTKEVRAVQGKEPKHFLAVFRGKMIVHQGRDPSTKEANTRGETRLACAQTGRMVMSLSACGAALYHVAGSENVYAKAVQTTPVAASLNSCNVFILTLKSSCFIWFGRFSNEHECAFARAAAAKPACSLHREDVREVKEGDEPAEFWNALDGKGTFPTQQFTARVDPRLFQCSIASGSFAVDEIPQFAQDDLVHDDVMILDAVHAVFVWVGRASHHTEQRLAYLTAVDYVKYSQQLAGRPTETPIWHILQGSEPYVFTVYFHGWDSQKHQSYDDNLTSVAIMLNEFNKNYSYDDLINKRFPKGLDESKLEAYLEPSEFERVLEMSKDQWENVPVWKKQKIKREKKLF
eukprot:TRINITY_DN629_c0_g1_i2.p1 TRINITY_DN629_c0_g1~~TRINITY_DN629_c0_g1_i2.p1  ORF type:complete len:1773 (+),score=466.32 TRINITY_DN629_c0_g1_i2:27-5345(+)